ncbi:MAG: hypothetical protein AAFW00_13550 [Bacteroidota bacterium]
MKTLKFGLSIVILWILIYAPSFAQQDLPEIIPPSPNAASLGEYGDVPVGYYTGIPDITIPIYNIAARDISLPISLSYHAGGLKVAEEASWVGLGWSLNAGGVITRTIQGGDDLKTNGNGYSGYPFDPDPIPLTDQNNDLDESNVTVSDFDFLANVCLGNQDGEPDLFFFNFGGYSGKFILQKGSTPHDVKVQQISQSNIKIEARHLTSPPLNGAQYDWKVTTPDGYQYLFQEQEITEIKSGSGLTEQQATMLTSAVPSHRKYSVNSWYLSEIISPKGEKITFIYESAEHRSMGPISVTETQITTLGLQKWCNCLSLSSSAGACSLTGTPGFTASQTISHDVYLQQIDFTGGYISFVTENREDIIKDPYPPFNSQPLDPQRLKEIVVYSNAVEEKKFAFNYNYFGRIGQAPIDPSRDRLQLLSLVESGGAIQGKQHQFSYYDPEKIPAKNSKSQDHWGYFNGKHNESLIPERVLLERTNPVYIPNIDNYPKSGWDNDCAAQFCDPNSIDYDYEDCAACWTSSFNPKFLKGGDRSSNEESMIYGALQRITYPLGGFAEFVYEAHDYSNFPYEIRRAIFKDTIQACGNTHNLNNCANPFGHGNMHTFTLAEPTFVFFARNLTRNCAASSGGCTSTPLYIPHYAELYGGSGQLLLAWSYTDPDDNSAVSSVLNQESSHYLAAGTYTIKVIPSDDAFVSMEIRYENPVTPTTQVLKKIGGGLRIKSLRISDGVNTANDKITTYNYEKLVGSTMRSSGRLMSPLVYDYMHFASDLLGKNNFSPNNMTGSPAQEFAICHNLFRSSSTVLPLGSSASGNSFGYDQVTVSQGWNGENGRSIYKYFNTEELIATTFFPDLPNRIYNSNGSLVYEEHLKNIGNNLFQKVSETSYKYNDKGWGDDLRAMNPKSFTTITKGVKTHATQCEYISLKFYDIVSEWWRMTEQVERVFDQDDETKFTETTTTYVYDEALGGSMQLIEERKDNSDGKVYVSRMTYPTDYDGNAPAWLNEMESRNMIAYPIEQFNSILDGGNEVVMSGSFQEYDLDPSVNFSGNPSGAILAKEIYQLETDFPIPLTNFNRSHPQGTMDVNYESQVLFEHYDDKGNLTQARKADKNPISYIWDQAELLPIAQVTNATRQGIAYTSFEGDWEWDAVEEPVISDGGWQILRNSQGSGGWVTEAERIATGQQGFHIQPNDQRKVQSRLLPAGEYILSYWYKGGRMQAAISGGNTHFSHEITDPDPVVMTYYEVKVTVGMNQSITLEPEAGDWNTYIDELRLYPVDAQMTTYCYDERNRIHTMTDVNNHSNYYHYDDLGRLRYVQDHDGNYVQGMEYNYRN